mmetsp:Transcript_92314/g.266470  ORF Transcript_92314/g.266470 Transcript_92314/m.266470 type:complete len:330 (+) Transcript_92314:565-1554(+)
MRNTSAPLSSNKRLTSRMPAWASSNSPPSLQRTSRTNPLPTSNRIGSCSDVAGAIVRTANTGCGPTSSSSSSAAGHRNGKMQPVRLPSGRRAALAEEDGEDGGEGQLFHVVIQAGRPEASGECLLGCRCATALGGDDRRAPGEGDRRTEDGGPATAARRDEARAASPPPAAGTRCAVGGLRGGDRGPPTRGDICAAAWRRCCSALRIACAKWRSACSSNVDCCSRCRRLASSTRCAALGAASRAATVAAGARLAAKPVVLLAMLAGNPQDRAMSLAAWPPAPPAEGDERRPVATEPLSPAEKRSAIADNASAQLHAPPKNKRHGWRAGT